MNKEKKDHLASIFVIGIIVGAVLGGYAVYLTDTGENTPEAPIEAHYDCELCQDTYNVIIIVLEGGKPTARTITCPYCQHEQGGGEP